MNIIVGGIWRKCIYCFICRLAMEGATWETLDIRMIIKRLFTVLSIEMWTGFSWLRVGFKAELLWAQMNCFFNAGILLTRDITTSRLTQGGNCAVPLV
jgi:hypothetical protein